MIVCRHLHLLCNPDPGDIKVPGPFTLYFLKRMEVKFAVDHYNLQFRIESLDVLNII